MVLLLNDGLLFKHSDPDPAFQPVAKAHVLYVYVILPFVSAALPRPRAVAICPAGMKRQNIRSNAESKRAAFLCKIRLNIT